MIIVKLENEEKRKEVIINKRKLKGNHIFIENYLSWEERKLQEKMGRWAREKRKEGVEIKIGRGRVRIAGIWRAWKEIEKKERERVERWRGGGMKKEKEGGEQEREV